MTDRCGTNGSGSVSETGLQYDDGVDEGRNEGAEHDLIDPVAHEAGDQARPELRGGERQRHQRHREHQARDADHRAGDRGQDLAGALRSDPQHPAGRPSCRAPRCRGRACRARAAPRRRDHRRRHQPQVGGQPVPEIAQVRPHRAPPARRHAAAAGHRALIGAGRRLGHARTFGTLPSARFRSRLARKRANASGTRHGKRRRIGADRGGTR